MADSEKKSPGLENRFSQPAGWRWDVFTDARGKNLRFGAVDPAGGDPAAVVIVLPGLSEFSEKYFEVARDMLRRNLAFRVLAWQGQGKSDRYLGNPHKRHTAGFDEDIADLHCLITHPV